MNDESINAQNRANEEENAKKRSDEDNMSNSL